jgi:uncharacterized protein YkwD
MKSPGHRANILSDEYTHCGIGLARAANGIFYATQVFAAPAPPVHFKTLGTTVIEKLNNARTAQGKLPFAVHPVLTRLAAQQAAATARAGKLVAVDLAELARAAGLDGKRLGMACVATWKPEELAKADALLAPKAGRIGLGLARNTEHRALGYGIIWSIVIFADE